MIFTCVVDFPKNCVATTANGLAITENALHLLSEESEKAVQNAAEEKAAQKEAESE